MKKKSTLSKITIAIVLIISTLTVNSLADPSESPVSIDIINPEIVEMGDTFNVSLNLSYVNDFDAANFDVLFNPEKINVTDVKDGKINETNIPISQWAFIEPGKVRIIVNIPGISGATGEGYLAELQFETISPGNSIINLSNCVLSNIYAEEIVAEWSSSFVQIQTIGDPEISIDVEMFNMFKIMIKFENTGDIDILELDWNAEIEPLFSTIINFSDNGTIYNLNKGNKKVLLTDQIGKGIDFINLKIKAEVNGYSFNREVYGIKIGPFLILFVES